MKSQNALGEAATVLLILTGHVDEGIYEDNINCDELDDTRIDFN